MSAAPHDPPTTAAVLADEELLEQLRAGQHPPGRLAHLLAAWRASVLEPTTTTSPGWAPPAR